MILRNKIKIGSGILSAVIIVFLSFMGDPAFSMGFDFGTPPPDPTTSVEPIITPGPLGAPIRVASYSKNALVVSDYSSGSIYYVSKRDPSQVRLIFKIQGRALAVGHLGKNIIVGNETSGTVEIYNRKGRLEYTLNENDKIERPSDLAVDQRKKQIFIVDSRGREVKVYTRKRLLHNFGSDVLINPVGIALDPVAELVYVSDHGDSMNDVPATVHVFTYGGVKLDQIDSETFGFYRPRGMAFDQGKLYITDALAGEVTVIDVNSMTKSDVLGEYGSDPGQLVQPQDVTIDRGGEVIFVANKRLGRIEKIATGGSP